MGVSLQKHANTSTDPIVLSYTANPWPSWKMPPPPPGFVYKPYRPLQRASTDLPNPPPKFDHKPRVLVRRDSRGRGGGQQQDAGGGKRSWYRSNSTPPDTRNHHDHGPAPRDGGTLFVPVSADDSRSWGVNWAKTFWEPGRVQTTQVQAQVQVNGPWGGQLQDAPRGRARRSSDARHPNPVLYPTPRPAQSTPPSRSHTPVIPGVLPTREMGLGKLFRSHSRDRKKILFYNKSKPHYGFTNFSPHPVEYLGRRYPTSEHLFQALKVSDGMSSLLYPSLNLFAIIVHSQTKLDGTHTDVRSSPKCGVGRSPEVLSRSSPRLEEGKHQSGIFPFIPV